MKVFTDSDGGLTVLYSIICIKPKRQVGLHVLFTLFISMFTLPVKIH